VRIWVRGEAETPSVGGGGRFLWGLQGLKKQRGREREERTLAGRKKHGRSCFFGLFWTRFSPPSGHKMTSIYRRWKREIFSTLEKTFSP